MADVVTVLAMAGRLMATADEAAALDDGAVPHRHERIGPDCPLDCLDLSPAVPNALEWRFKHGKGQKIRTVGDLVLLVDSGELRRVRMIGPRRHGEVCTALIAAGFSLYISPSLRR
ncbi:hypothetical protein ACGFNU_30220 [Spirillospora sp. NPDC048911]|uniref:hypothetical protein n=1 Tax=Spirillospora sp. NPDC048911 TaxID=3364527 RepID=UPI003714A26F